MTVTRRLHNGYLPFTRRLRLPQAAFKAAAAHKRTRNRFFCFRVGGGRRTGGHRTKPRHCFDPPPVIISALARRCTPRSSVQTRLHLVHPVFLFFAPLPTPCTQAGVEKEIQQMEGVMEIDASAAARPSQQSPSAPGTPGAAGSQGSATTTGDPEWLLPVLLSVTPPTDGDCRELLARVASSSG